jgi:hypothetical protein
MSFRVTIHCIYTFGALKSIKNGIELIKLWPPKVEGGQKLKNKPLNVTKASLQTPKNILLCFSIAIQVPR